MLGLKLLEKVGELPTAKIFKTGGKYAGKLPLAQAAKKANMPIYEMFKKRYG